MATTKLEKRFFDTFGVTKRMDFICSLDVECPETSKCEECKHYNNPERTKYYPEITDRHLIELIKLIGKPGFGYVYCQNTHSTGYGQGKENVVMVEDSNFKEAILTLLMQPRVQLAIGKQAVKDIFKE